MLKSILIIDVNHITHVKHMGRRSGPKFGKHLYFRAYFRKINQSMENSTNMKFTHNVDLEMMKIVDEENVIYVIVAIEKLKK